MALPRRRFVSWVERRMLSPGSIPARFELVHVASSGRALVCKLQPSSEGSGADDIGEALATEVHEEVIDHVEAWSGRQNYIVRAFAEGDREVGEFAFFQHANSIVHTNAAQDLAELTPEQHALASGRIPETMGGHPTAMVSTALMRHTESLTRFVVEMAAMQRERDAQIIKSQQVALDKQESQHFKMLELMEGMLSQQQERQIRQSEFEAEESRKERLLGQLNDLVIPGIAEHLGVKPRLRDKMTGELREIFFSLPEDMQQEVFRALPEEKKDKLLEYMGQQTEATKH